MNFAILIRTTEFMNNIEKPGGELLDSLREMIGLGDSYKSARDEYDQHCGGTSRSIHADERPQEWYTAPDMATDYLFWGVASAASGRCSVVH
jgi:hypothetical protein